MTTQHSSHADTARPAAPLALSAGPQLPVQRPLSREPITIRFSPLGLDAGGEHSDEEDDELNWANISAPATRDDPGVVTAVEVGEELREEAQSDAVTSPESSAATPPPAKTKVANPSASSWPTKSVSLPSIDSAPFSMVKSLSSDAEPAAASSNLLVKHRQLMKSLVKSLSSDQTEGPSASSSSSSSSSSSVTRPSDSRLNLQLFKQFTQSRMSANATAAAALASDSKTAPCSPLTVHESRSFFNVSEVEARIEDTKRRFSEAMYEPLQKLSKIMDEKSVANYMSSRSSSGPASELSNMSSLSSLSQAESNNNSYCIKEEEGGDWDSESPSSGASYQPESPVQPAADGNKKPRKPPGSMILDTCSMSALARLEEEDYCILSTEDFETCAAGESRDRTDYSGSSSRSKGSPSGATEPCSEDESELGEPAPYVPVYTLLVLAGLVYGYFVLPMPPYVGGMLMGVALGFFIAIGVVWLAGPKPSGRGLQHWKRFRQLRSLAKFSFKEPDLLKGWMNEIAAYDPETYHATLTQSVYVRLEGSTLRLSKPNRNIPRRAMHNEPKPDVSYISQKIYDLTDSKVYLVPHHLARKRLWNKKYPICIELAKQDDFMSKAEGERSDARQEPTSAADAASVVPGDRGGGTGRGKPLFSSQDLTLYLFGRTGREKEEWFKRIIAAAQGKGRTKRATSSAGIKQALSPLSPTCRRGSSDETPASLTKTKEPSASSSSSSSQLAANAKARSLLDYSVYMTSLLATKEASPVTASPPPRSAQNSPEAAKKLPGGLPARTTEEEQPVAWLNAMLGRLLWDFLGESYWAEMVSQKIQMKLSKIRLPYFMNELTLTELDMGVATPRILGASKPSVDHRGLWFDLDVAYSGSFLMTLETKMNLIRLGKEEDALRVEPGKDGPRTYCLADSDEESSSAGSSDEEDQSELTSDSVGAEGFVGGHKPSKIMKIVDKITKSKYFQKATETEFIKKKMEEMSNTPLLLTVEAQEIRGTLAVNIPPPPTDRIWYGFRTPPHLELKARPKLGEREVTFAHVTDWIEKKLYQEFQKVLVMPNMDDVWLTLMHSAMDPRTSGGPLVPPAADPPLPSQPAEGPAN